MVIEGVGIGSTNSIRVRRSWLGTALAGYSTGNLVTKVIGNYNIVDNTLNFVEAPYGNTPLGTSTNPPDERDWVGTTGGVEGVATGVVEAAEPIALETFRTRTSRY